MLAPLFFSSEVFVMLDVDHQLLAALREIIRPIVREVVAEEFANYKPPPVEPQDYLSIKNASRRFDIPEATLRKWITCGQLNKYKIHDSVKVKVSEIVNLLVK